MNDIRGQAGGVEPLNEEEKQKTLRTIDDCGRLQGSKNPLAVLWALKAKELLERLDATETALAECQTERDENKRQWEASIEYQRVQAKVIGDLQIAVGVLREALGEAQTFIEQSGPNHLHFMWEPTMQKIDDALSSTKRVWTALDGGS